MAARSADGAGSVPRHSAELNWVLHSYGQSADPVITAAVNLYVWSVADPGTYGSHGMSGDEYYSGRAGDARAAVLANLAEIRAAAGGVPGAGSVEVELAPDLTGRAIVHDPAGMGATLTIEGADAVGPVVVADGAVVEFVAQPGAGDRTAVVEATARFAWRSFPAAITVHDSGPEQHLAGPAGEALVAVGRAQVPLEFHPVIESAVTSPVLAIGERAVDRLAFAVATDSPAPWRAGAGVTAKGTLYGPFAAPPPGRPVATTRCTRRVERGHRTGRAARVHDLGRVRTGRARPLHVGLDDRGRGPARRQLAAGGLRVERPVRAPGRELRGRHSPSSDRRRGGSSVVARGTRRAAPRARPGRHRRRREDQRAASRSDGAVMSRVPSSTVSSNPSRR